MTRTQIEYILALAKSKNFGIAAVECFISQSTLSAMIAKFERQIDVELFSRKTRPIQTTINGNKIIESLENINREFLLLDELIREINEVEKGKISLACIPTVAPFIYPLILNKISNEFKHVDFNIYELTTEKIIQDIKGGKIDIGIVSLPLNTKDLVEYALYEEEFFVYDFGNKQKSKRYKITDIDLNRLWILEEGHCMRNQIGKICDLRQKKKMNGNLTYSCGSIDALIKMVNLNNGITLLPHLAIENNKNVDKRFIYTFQGQKPMRRVGIIVHKNFVRKRLLKQFIEIINTLLVLPKHSGKSLNYLKPV